jgi:hypothetical protein
VSVCVCVNSVYICVHVCERLYERGLLDTRIFIAPESAREFVCTHACVCCGGARTCANLPIFAHSEAHISEPQRCMI